MNTYKSNTVMFQYHLHTHEHTHKIYMYKILNVSCNKSNLLQNYSEEFGIHYTAYYKRSNILNIMA